MDERPRHTFLSDFRIFFLKGLGILLPSIITLAILAWAFSFLRSNIAEPINAAVRSGVLYVAPQIGSYNARDPDQRPAWYRVTDEELAAAAGGQGELDELNDARRATLRNTVRAESLREYWNGHWYLQGIGFAVAVIAVYLAGVFVGNYLGRRIYQRLEGFFVRIPVIKQVYPNVKQIIDFLIGNEQNAMPASGKVVLLEWPRKGVWTVGLSTGASMKTIEQLTGEDTVTVFIPNSPTPFTGFTVNIPKSDTRDIDLSMDEAIRFVVSGGVLVPPRQRPAGLPPITAGDPDTLPPDDTTARDEQEQPPR
jgi:uncharacterized membrane protein